MQTMLVISFCLLFFWSSYFLFMLCFFMFSHELSFWTLTVVVVISFESPGLQRNSFPSTLLQFIIYFSSLCFWNENMLLVSMGFIWVILLSCCVCGMPFFLMVFHFVFDYCAIFFTLHNRQKKCNNELGLSHQDGGNVSSHKRKEPDLDRNIFIHVLLSV